MASTVDKTSSGVPQAIRLSWFKLGHYFYETVFEYFWYIIKYCDVLYIVITYKIIKTGSMEGKACTTIIRELVIGPKQKLWMYE